MAVNKWQNSYQNAKEVLGMPKHALPGNYIPQHEMVHSPVLFTCKNSTPQNIGNVCIKGCRLAAMISSAEFLESIVEDFSVCASHAALSPSFSVSALGAAFLCLQCLCHNR